MLYHIFGSLDGQGYTKYVKIRKEKYSNDILISRSHRVRVYPISDALCEDGEGVCAHEQGAALGHGAHASKLLILLDNLAKDLIVVVAPADDLAIIAA